MEEPEDRLYDEQLHLRLLAYYKDGKDSLSVPPGFEDMLTLWHPDLHGGNVCIDPGTGEIMGILDWQTVDIAPLFFREIMPALAHELTPDTPSSPILQQPSNDSNGAASRDLGSPASTNVVHRNQMIEALKALLGSPLIDILNHPCYGVLPNPFALFEGLKGYLHSHLKESWIIAWALLEKRAGERAVSMGSNSAATHAHRPLTASVQYKDEDLERDQQSVSEFHDILDFHQQVFVALDADLAGYCADEETYERKKPEARALRDRLVSSAQTSDECSRIAADWPFPDIV